ncbi:hypothetical protein C8R46DRAFT_393683 [Mycena filopes]|nr:hypothetical protein C8R46DRAFT_393683 [Mycena filopes]
MRRRRGFPLYVPGPLENLPDEYQVRGIAIGDVGRITPEGIFDFFFNIYLPADHPVNDDDVPENFYPLLPYASKDVVTLEYRPGNHVSTSSVRQLVLPSPEEFPGAEFRFHCGVTQGAALALPHGSRLRKLENLEAVREYVATHAESWYEYVKRVRGRDLANGSLYLVTGCEKAQSWGMTSFYGTSEEFQLVLRPSPRTSRYRWSGTPDRPDPSQHKVYDEHTTHTPLNQTTFIHGLSISLGVGIWGKLFGQVGIRDIVESELGNANRSRDTPQAPGSSFFSWSFGLLGGGGSTGGTRHAGESGNVTLSDFPPIGKVCSTGVAFNS